MSNETKLGIILNPIAGRGRANKAAGLIINYLHNKRIPFHMETTNAPGHAKEIARQMKDNYEIIAAAGGDGTVNEVATGMFGSKSSLALLPIGSGNDFSKIFGMPNGLNNIIDVILNGKKKLIDFGQILFWNSYGERKKHYFINTLGIGLDAEIAHETQKIRFIRGLPLYLLAAIKALSKHSPNEYKINIENKETIERAFLVCIGNGSHEGGGFKLLPHASAHDSLLDICLIRKMSIINAVRLIPRLIKGTHYKEKKISLFRSKKVSVEAERPFVLHGDGEILAHNAVKVKIELAPKRINVIVPGKY